MKARNKLQKFMVEWSNSHSTLTERQTRYAHKHCFNDMILHSRSMCLCTHCHNVWKSKPKTEMPEEAVCPVCKKKMSVTEHKTKIKMDAYFTVFTTVNKMQVARWFLVERYVGKDYDECRAFHVGTEFLTEEGKRYSVERSRATMCWEKDRWCFSCDEQELRKHSVFERYIASSASYFTRVLPILKRNGFKCNHNKMGGLDVDVMVNLLLYPQFESLMKIGHYAVMRTWISRGGCDYWGRKQKPYLTDAETTLIKMANRKHVVFDTKVKWADYNDYVKDLEYMGKDIHNPSVVFPENFDAAHLELHKRAEARRHREHDRIEERNRIARMTETSEKNQAWISRYTACYSDMMLAEKDFCIKPLITIDDFNTEAARMHHCIAGYYGKQDTLLLTIEHGGIKCETAEIDLRGRGNIIQCRGVCNKSSQYHTEIVAILKKNMKEFLKRYTMSVKPRTTLPVLASFYEQQIAI